MKKLLLSLLCILTASAAAFAQTTVIDELTATSLGLTGSNSNSSKTFTESNVTYSWQQIKLYAAKNPHISGPKGEIFLYDSKVPDNYYISSIEINAGDYVGQWAKASELYLYTSETEFTSKPTNTSSAVLTITKPSNNGTTFEWKNTSNNKNLKYFAITTNNNTVIFKSVTITWEKEVSGPQDFNPNFQDITMFPGEEGNILTDIQKHPDITFTSSDEDVVIVANDGSLLAGDAGTATVTAKWDASDDWNAGETSFTVTIAKKEFSNSFATSLTLWNGQTADLQAGWPEVRPSFTYTSSNNDVATVSEAGIVTATGSTGETATITATATDETLKIWNISHSYEITVNIVDEPSIKEVTFNFTGSGDDALTSFAGKTPGSSTTTGDSNDLSNKKEKIGLVTLEFDDKGSPNVRWFISSKGKQDARIYTGGSFTISVPEGYIITKVEFPGDQWGGKNNSNKIEPKAGSFVLSTKTWTANANTNTLTVSCGGTTQIDKFIVTYDKLQNLEAPALTVESAATQTIAKDGVAYTVKAENVPEGASLQPNFLLGEEPVYTAAMTGNALELSFYDEAGAWTNADLKGATVYTVNATVSKFTYADAISESTTLLTVPRYTIDALNKFEGYKDADESTGGLIFYSSVNDENAEIHYTITTGERDITEATATLNSMIEIPDYKNATLTFWAVKDGVSSPKINASLADITTSVDGIDADNNAPEQWYDLQGRRVNSDNLLPGLYIKKQGKKALKVVIR